MKTKMFFLILTAGLLILTSGCAGPYFGSEAQYNRGKWHGWAGPREVARTKADKLAFDKLRDAPALTLTTNGVFQGYLGVIANMSTYRRLLFKYDGPETSEEYLGPGQQDYIYLLPGDYHGEIFYGGQKVGWVNFTSGPKIKKFLGTPVSWIFGSEY